mmetsp:Transcript_30376/g.96925  ORF Transcript_30376/g.96925 Transcript_30376/m.96925 type:complete len:85 (-) Transcript_30376:473-727(-)
MAQRLTRLVKLLVPAGGAKPGPAIGQSLGPLGLNMAEFCKDFNAKTAGHMADVPIPVVMYSEAKQRPKPEPWFLNPNPNLSSLP